jgi:DNA polymerase I-like protein with 3'-5' exonuclease and polymerase domains
MPVDIKRGKETTPKRSNQKTFLTEGAAYCPVKFVPGNPNSPTQWRKILLDAGAPLTKQTKTGNLKAGLQILKDFDFPNKKQIMPYFVINQRCKQLFDGDGSYINSYNPATERIHGTIDAQGTYTGRAAHRNPNVNVPRPEVKNGHPIMGEPGRWNADFRDLFTACTPLPYLVGVDIDALEARTIAHVLEPFDGGETVNLILNGKKEDGTDIHSRNMRAMQLNSRDTAKRVLYGISYGAGIAKVAEICECTMEEAAEVRNKLYAAMPALRRASYALQDEVSRRGYMTLCSGRPCYVKTDILYTAFAARCQGDGAEICKRWVKYQYMLAIQDGLAWGQDFAIAAWVHDETQTLARTEEIAKKVIGYNKTAILMAEKELQYKCPLYTDNGKIGRTWLETH